MGCAWSHPGRQARTAQHKQHANNRTTTPIHSEDVRLKTLTNNTHNNYQHQGPYFDEMLPDLDGVNSRHAGTAQHRHHDGRGQGGALQQC